MHVTIGLKVVFFYQFPEFRVISLLWDELAFITFIYASLLWRDIFSFSLAVAYVVDELQCIKENIFLAFSELRILLVISFSSLLNLLDFTDVDLLFESIQLASHITLIFLKKRLCVTCHAKTTGWVNIDVVRNEESFVLKGLHSSLAIGSIFFWHAIILLMRSFLPNIEPRPHFLH